MVCEKKKKNTPKISCLSVFKYATMSDFREYSDFRDFMSRSTASLCTRIGTSCTATFLARTGTASTVLAAGQPLTTDSLSTVQHPLLSSGTGISRT